MRRFDQRTAQPAIAFAGLATPPLAGTLVLTRAQTGPRRQVPGSWEALYIWANFCDDDLRGATTDARDGVQPLEHFLKRALTLSDFTAHALDGLIQKVDMRQDLGH